MIYIEDGDGPVDRLTLPAQLPGAYRWRVGVRTESGIAWAAWSTFHVVAPSPKPALPEKAAESTPDKAGG